MSDSASNPDSNDENLNSDRQSWDESSADEMPGFDASADFFDQTKIPVPEPEVPATEMMGRKIGSYKIF
ncbi:MAG: hypothetical protein AAF939_08345 [Planctomycetota bacterium]